MKTNMNHIHPMLVPILSMALAISPIVSHAQESVTDRNKKIIQEGFAKWSSGTGSLFDLLSDTMQWQITGSTSHSKLYTGKKQFMDEVIVPLNQRLSKKIVPTVRALFADGDWVIALWDGQATTLEGKPYNMSYSWYMQLKDGKIVNVIAFLDGIQFNEVMKIMPAKSN